jgi:hypothetical protein
MINPLKFPQAPFPKAEFVTVEEISKVELRYVQKTVRAIFKLHLQEHDYRMLIRRYARPSDKHVHNSFDASLFDLQSDGRATRLAMALIERNPT